MQRNCHSHSLTLVSLCGHGLLVFVCKGFHLSDECVSALSLSHIQLLATLRTVACQAPLSMGFSRQGYGSGEPFHSPGDLPNPGTEPGSPALQADSYHLSCQGSPSTLWLHDINLTTQDSLMLHHHKDSISYMNESMSNGRRRGRSVPCFLISS